MFPDLPLLLSDVDALVNAMEDLQSDQHGLHQSNVLQFSRLILFHNKHHKDGLSQLLITLLTKQLLLDKPTKPVVTLQWKQIELLLKLMPLTQHTMLLNINLQLLKKLLITLLMLLLKLKPMLLKKQLLMPMPLLLQTKLLPMLKLPLLLLELKLKPLQMLKLLPLPKLPPNLKFLLNLKPPEELMLLPELKLKLLPDRLLLKLLNSLLLNTLEPKLKLLLILPVLPEQELLLKQLLKPNLMLPPVLKPKLKLLPMLPLLLTKLLHLKPKLMPKLVLKHKLMLLPQPKLALKLNLLLLAIIMPNKPLLLPSMHQLQQELIMQKHSQHNAHQAVYIMNAAVQSDTIDLLAESNNSL